MTPKELLAFLGDSRDYNLHTHTPYCDGRSSIRDMADEAARIGMTVLGFSSHGPVSLGSPCNIPFPDVAPYLAEIREVSEIYQPLKILCGMEIDYLDKDEGPHSAYFQDLGLDYSIGSVHFLRDRKGEFQDCDGKPERFVGYLKYNFGNDLRYVVEKYFDAYLEMIGAGGFTILGHPDKIARNASFVDAGIESYPWYQRWVKTLIEEASKKDCIMEVNTKIMTREGRIFPAEGLLPEVIAAGIPLVVNSDAHEAELLTSGREKAFEIIDNIINQ